MNEVVKKIAKIALIVVASFIVAVIVFVILAFVRADIKWKRSFNNPIIDTKFKGWSTLELDDTISIKFPDAWEFERKGDSLYVLDEHGKQIAVGAKVSQVDGFMTSVYGSTWEEKNIIWAQTINYNNMCSTWATALKYEDGRSETYLVLEVRCVQNDYFYYLYFFSDETGTLYRDEVVAIAFSENEHKAK